MRQINTTLGDKLSRDLMTAKPLWGINTLCIDAIEATDNKIETVFVNIDTLDHFSKENGIKKINLLKIDAEGYEMKVRKGAEQLLSSYLIDYILIECDFFRKADQPHGDFIEIFNYLQTFQYNVVSFYTGAIDKLGWIFGDVLFCKTNGEQPGPDIWSPFEKSMESNTQLKKHW